MKLWSKIDPHNYNFPKNLQVHRLHFLHGRDGRHSLCSVTWIYFLSSRYQYELAWLCPESLHDTGIWIQWFWSRIQRLYVSKTLNRGFSQTNTHIQCLSRLGEQKIMRKKLHMCLVIIFKRSAHFIFRSRGHWMQFVPRSRVLNTRKYVIPEKIMVEASRWRCTGFKLQQICCV